MKNDDLAPFYFHQGTNMFSYKYLGCNLEINDKNKRNYSFRTWAPFADGVSLVGDFCGWDNPIKMNKITEKGIWECILSLDYSIELNKYKFIIYRDDKQYFKGDPYAFFSVGGDDGASIIFTSKDYKWQDYSWLSYRKNAFSICNKPYICAPLNIYEIHLGSFMRTDDNGFLNYRDLARELVPYVKSMGYTHIELLPIAEHPFDASWGYQICAYYAPSSRFGNPDDFRFFIDSFHKCGIGVILDWVPAHFPKDEWGLYEFDGGPLYEYQGKDRKESSTWGTRYFDLAREEVQSFLISNALYYFREFHIDGLRVDAVASMLYLDYDRAPGEWIPNSNGGNENLEAIAFFRKLNSEIYKEFPDVMMIAEESGAYGKITTPVKDGGLGFSMKWNMGFANDFYDYLMTDPIYRKYKHKSLNFPIMYAFSENYCLPISHDEVVHGKLSFINKMHGSYEDKFLEMRIALLLYICYPGKKLTFMGTEFAQFREWDYNSSLEWFMLDYKEHKNIRDYVLSLNSFYLSSKELWEIDFETKGFAWIFADENDKNTIAFKRISQKGEYLIVVINFSGATQNISIPIEKDNYLEAVFESIPNVISENSIKIQNVKNERFADISLPRFYGAVFREKSKNIIINL